jgi:capsid portal protein
MVEKGASMARDSWLYGTKQQRKAVEKAARRAKGQLEASSDETFQYLSKTSSERAANARIVHWGASKADGSNVSVVNVSKSAGDEPPPSRQLRDPFTAFYVQGMALEPPLPPERLLNLTEESPFHSACVDAKATDACGRGWSFESKEGKDDDAETAKSPIPEQLRQMMEDLTPDLTFTELLHQAAWEMGAIGWGVWEVVRTSNDGKPGKHGDIGALYPVPSHTIRACVDPRKWVQIRAGRIRYFKKFGEECTAHNETGEIFEWKGKNSKRAGEVQDDNVASELIVFKTYTPRSLWYGMPRWLSAIPTIAELGAIREFNVSWFASGGQVDYHMHFKASGLEMATQMKEQVEEQVREFAGRGHTNILTAGDESTEVNVQKLGELLREGHFRFRRGDLVKEVLIAHATPPYRIGWAETGSLGGNAAPEMLAAYKVGAVEPIQRVIEDRLRSTLFDPKKGIKTGEFRLKLKELDLEDLQKELEKMKAGVERAVITPNQGRKMLHFTPVDDKPEMDEYYYSGQKLGEKPPSPFGGGGPGQPGFGNPGDPNAPLPPGGGPDGAGFGSQNVDGSHGQYAEAEKAARSVVVDMLRGYEAKVKAALADNDPPRLPLPRTR